MLTETQVLEQWIEHYLPYIMANEAERGGRVDRPMRRESWCNFIDSLEQDGQITEEMAYNYDANVCDL